MPLLNKRLGGRLVSSSRIHLDWLCKKLQPSPGDALRGSTSLALPSLTSMVTERIFALRLRLTFIGKGTPQVWEAFPACGGICGGSFSADS